MPIQHNAAPGVQDFLINAVAGVRNVEPSGLHAEFAESGKDLGVDSLEVVEMMLEIEDQFGIRFPDTQETCDAFQSISRLTELIQQLVAAEGGSTDGH